MQCGCPGTCTTFDKLIAVSRMGLPEEHESFIPLKTDYPGIPEKGRNIVLHCGIP
jgi:hypothetical protein